jgi:uncharacterized cupin superfamily protein
VRRNSCDINNINEALACTTAFTDFRSRHLQPTANTHETGLKQMPAIALYLAIDDQAARPETNRPPAEKVISGDPVHTTWNAEERDGLYCGIWQSTPGKWRIAYDEWEFCHILEGVSVIGEDGGAAHTVRAGDSFILRPGFRGTWAVLETTRKEYVIRL